MAIRTNPRTGQRYVSRSTGPFRTQFGRGEEGGPIDDGGVEVPDGEGDGGTIVAPPIDLAPLFPEFTPVDFERVQFPTIDAAPFQFTDPQAFAKAFGQFNREELQKNFGLATDFSFKALANELAGLKAFAPAAGALAREQTSIDNQFNQMMRQRQVQSALPNARGDLAAQRQRAASYARGELPDTNLDRSLELGIRSRAADRAGFSGIGPRSLQAEKVSDLMSAEERLQIAQYGENLIGQNIGTSANLFLAPTEYAQVGSQIRPTPEVGAGRLTYQGLGMANEATLLSPGTALEATIQQNQFGTNLEQRTREFNATGTYNASTFNSQGQLQADMFNSTGAFTAGLGLFNYQVGFAAQQQAAAQAQLNGALGIGSQGVINNAAGGQFQASQPSTFQTIAQGAGAVNGALQTTQQVLSGNGSGGGGVGGTSSGSGSGGAGIDSGPSEALTNEPLRPTEFDTTLDFSSGSRGPDPATPYTMKVSDGVPTPSGYQRVSGNSDGTYSAVNVQGYQSELDRFARSAGVPQGSISVPNALQADRDVTNAAGLSYVPIQGFRPIALSGGGNTVYSLPAAADSGNYLKGAANVENLALVAAQLGVSDASVEGALNDLSADVSDPAFHRTLDQLALEKGDAAVAAAITNQLLGAKPDLKTNAGQQFTVGAQRIGELWTNLSPEQKSMALTALTGSALELKSGKNLASTVIPGSDRSPIGPMTAGDAMTLTTQGMNGFALARNWNQLSTISSIATDARSTRQVAQIADRAGLMGFGAQGSSVPVPPEYLNKVGAVPVPSLGVGMMQFDRPNLVPPHYSIVSQSPEGKPLAMPTNLMHTSPLSGSDTKPLVYKQAQLISRGRHPVQRLWGRAPSGPIKRGAAGGSAIVSGLNTMVKANPAIFSSVVAQSLFANTLTLAEQIAFGDSEKPFTGLTPEQIEQGQSIDPGFNINAPRDSADMPQSGPLQPFPDLSASDIQGVASV
jgi:hypothetical protein